MDYAQFSSTSHVAVIGDPKGTVNCISCSLDDKYETVKLRSPHGAVLHFQKHKNDNHLIPENLLKESNYREEDFLPFNPKSRYEHLDTIHRMRRLEKGYLEYPVRIIEQHELLNDPGTIVNTGERIIDASPVFAQVSSQEAKLIEQATVTSDTSLTWIFDQAQLLGITPLYDDPVEVDLEPLRQKFGTDKGLIQTAVEDAKNNPPQDLIPLEEQSFAIITNNNNRLDIIVKKEAKEVKQHLRLLLDSLEYEDTDVDLEDLINFVNSHIANTTVIKLQLNNGNLTGSHYY